MATKSSRKTGSKKAQKPRTEVRDLKARKDPKGGLNPQPLPPGKKI